MDRPINTPDAKIGKNMNFWREIAIFLHEMPQIFSRFPPLGAIFLSAPPPPPNLKSWIRPCMMLVLDVLINS